MNGLLLAHSSRHRRPSGRRSSSRVPSSTRSHNHQQMSVSLRRKLGLPVLTPEAAARWRKAHPGVPTGDAALADPDRHARAQDLFRRIQAAKDWSQAQRRRLSPDERRRVGRMPCGKGDRYLARRVDRLDHDRHLLDQGRHRRDPGQRPVRRRGSRRSTSASRDGPSDLDDDDLGVLVCCPICGASLDGLRSDATYCSPACRMEASRLRRLGRRRSGSGSPRPLPPTWNGGRGVQKWRRRRHERRPAQPQ